MSLELKHKYFTKKKLIAGVPLILFGVAVYLFLNFDDIYFNYSPKKATFSKLEKIRQSKKAKVTRYLDKQKEMGKKASCNNDINNY